MEPLTPKQQKLLEDNYDLIEKMFNHVIAKTYLPPKFHDNLLDAMHDIAISSASKYDEKVGCFRKYLSTGLHFAYLYAAQRNKQKVREPVLIFDRFDDCMLELFSKESAPASDRYSIWIDNLLNELKKVLEPSEYKCFLYHISGYNYTKTGTMLKCSRKTVKRRTESAIKHIQNIMEKDNYANLL